MIRTTTLLSSMVMLNLTSLSAGWVSQHVYGMQPCPWCVLQRAVFSALALLALLGLFVRHQPKALAGLSVLGSTLALSGAAAALWQHFVAASQVSCNLTLADKILSALYLDQAWPAMFLATASCAEAAALLAGLPYEFWSLAVFVVLAGVWMWLIKVCGFPKPILDAGHQSGANARQSPTTL